jgi:uncharacterized membrane protein
MAVDLILFFAIYSFLGWVMETLFASIKHRKFINRGFLRGPFTPIYGFGGIIIVSYFNWSPFSLEDKSLLLMINLIVSILLVTILEFVTGFILEKIFHEKWWDYSYNFLNIKGYICIKYSMLWGMLAFALIQIVHPIIINFTRTIPVQFKEYVAIIIVVYFIIDTIKSIIDILDLRRTILLYSELSVHVYKNKIIKYKRIFLAFPKLLFLNAGIINRDVRRILNGRVDKIKTEFKNKFHT